MIIHVWHHGNEEKLDRIIDMLGTLVVQGDKMSAQLDALTAQVASNTTVIDSAITLINGLAAAIVAAGTDPVKLQALTDALTAEDTKLAAAITANTPPSPPGP